MVKHQGRIHEIAEYCKTTEFYKHSAVHKCELKIKYSENMDAVECFIDLLVKIKTAPIELFAIGAMCLLFPVLDEKLDSVNGVD